MSAYLHDDDVVAGPVPSSPEPRAKRPKLVGSDDVVGEVVDDFAISPRFSPAAFVASAPSDIGQYFESLDRDLEQRQQQRQQQDVAAPVPSSPGPSSLGLWKRPCTPDRGSSPVAPECSPLTPKVQQQFLGGSSV